MKITLELTIHEAEVLRIALSSSLPSKENEMISLMLYNRLIALIKQAAEGAEKDT
jgi:hypothetical protein